MGGLPKCFKANEESLSSSKKLKTEEKNRFFRFAKFTEMAKRFEFSPHIVCTNRVRW